MPKIENCLNLSFQRRENWQWVLFKILFNNYQNRVFHMMLILRLIKITLEMRLLIINRILNFYKINY